jgi:hypothetical protein
LADFLIFGVLLLQFVSFVVGFHGFHSLSSAVKNSEERLNALARSPEVDLAPVISEITGVIEDIVSDTLQNLEPPRAIDHVFGAVAQMIQARTMKMMSLPPGLNEVVEQVQEHFTEEAAP